MVVAFTPNIGLAKPDKNEIAKNWTGNGFDLIEDNNVIIAAQAEIPINTYTPILTAQTTPPNVGAGSIKGQWQDIQGIIFGGFTIDLLDPGVFAGVGEWAISLPVVMDNVYHQMGGGINSVPGALDIIGEGYLYDLSSTNASGSCALDAVNSGGVSYVRMILEGYATKANRLYQTGNPFTPVTGDKFVGTFVYKKL